MAYENNLPEWKNEGTEPSEELQTNGFQGGYKPPAGIFNWFWHKVSACIRELQNIVDGKINKSQGLGLMGFGTNNANGKTRDTILVIDSVTGLPTVKSLVNYESDLNLDMQKVTATSSDGKSYTATIGGITELFAGLTITIVPNTTSATTQPTLNLNSLGAKTIKRSICSNIALAVPPTMASWLVKNYPTQITYDGTCWKTTTPRTDANDVYGTVSLEHGGTGADNAKEARENLGLTKAMVMGFYEYVGDGTYGEENATIFTVNPNSSIDNLVYRVEHPTYVPEDNGFRARAVIIQTIDGSDKIHETDIFFFDQTRGNSSTSVIGWHGNYVRIYGSNASDMFNEDGMLYRAMIMGYTVG